MTGLKVWVSGGGQKYHAIRECTALADGRDKARREGRRNRALREVDLSQLGAEPGKDDRAPCAVCWPASPGWNDWSSIEHRTIRLGQSEYQTSFLADVLRRMPELRAGDIEAEKEFKYYDGDGRVDFTIVNDQVRLAIEVDGTNKSPVGQPLDQDDHARQARRQNELVHQGWKVLRFTNTDARMDPDRCRKEIERALKSGKRSGAPAADASPPSPTAAASNPSLQPAPIPSPVAVQVEKRPGTAATVATPTRGRRPWLAVAVAVILAIGGATLIRIVATNDDPSRSGTPDGMACPSDLPVKGNDSQSGDRIYHEPGWRYYDDTSPERCFADGEAAEDDGYRASEAR